MTDFPLLDANYAVANAELGRVILDAPGVIEPGLVETDGYATIPIRLVYDQAAGIHLELGPYSLDGKDIEALREAIRCYDMANTGPGLRRVK